MMLIAVAGCAAVERPPRSSLAPAAAACAQWLQRLDHAVEQAGVRDGAAYRIPGFPYLRVDRFSASFRNEVADDRQKFAAWVGRLRMLDETARASEVNNLPARFLRSLGSEMAAVKRHSHACAAELARADLADANRRAALIARAQVPDDYSEWNRVLGLYPIAGIPVAIAINRWQEETVATFRRMLAGAHSGRTILKYEPAAAPVDGRRTNAVFARARTDPLGIPQFSKDDRERLFAAFAPVFEIETAGAYDHFGRLVWGTGAAPEAEVLRPTVYRRLAFTRYRGRVLAQLVYTIWFPERPRKGALDLLSGKLDGLVFRVTLDPQGQPLIYDSIHPCGCYHMFFPTARVRLNPSPRPDIEWAFVPATLPLVDPSERIVVRLASGSHFIVGLRFDTGGRAIFYRFAEDDELRALPAPGGATRSAFGPDGIVPGTDRGERLLFWPTGVRDTGAMREWGTHATAFLGRRHFDDPDLIERRFTILEPRFPAAPARRSANGAGANAAEGAGR